MEPRRRVADYKLVVVHAWAASSAKIAMLEREVREHIARGWEPLGGVAIDGATFVCVQAMVKYADEPAGEQS